MKKKIIIAIIIILAIVLLAILTCRFVYKRNEKKELYIAIERIHGGITDLYVPTSRYEIYNNGEVEYIPNTDKSERNNLKKLKNSQLKEIYNSIINSDTKDHYNDSKYYQGDFYYTARIQGDNNIYYLTIETVQEIINNFK